MFLVQGFHRSVWFMMINIARKRFPKMSRHISHIGKHFFFAENDRFLTLGGNLCPNFLRRKSVFFRVTRLGRSALLSSKINSD